MRLLMTRPEPDASVSAAKLRAKGHEVIVSPVLETVFVTDPLVSPPGTALFVTSRNAVRSIMAQASAEQRDTCSIFAVGNATARLAREAGFKIVHSASGTVDDLVELIKSHAVESGTYYCGRDRKGDLERKLESFGLKVTVSERYRTEFVEHLTPAALAAFHADHVNGILLYSERSARAFLRLTKRKNISCSPNLYAFFCLANAIARVFDKAERTHLHIAEAPHEEALFALIDRFAKERE